MKSHLIQILLTLFFGPIGVFYSSIAGGLACTLLAIISFMLIHSFMGGLIIAVFPLYFSAVWIGSMITGAACVQARNRN